MSKKKLIYMLLCLSFNSLIAYLTNERIILLTWGFGITLYLWITEINHASSI